MSSPLAVAFLTWTFQRSTLQFTLQRELPYFSILIKMDITTNLQKEMIPRSIYYWHELIKGKLVISEQTDKGLCNIRILKSTNRVDYCFIIKLDFFSTLFFKCLLPMLQTFVSVFNSCLKEVPPHLPWSFFFFLSQLPLFSCMTLISKR